MRLQVTLEQQLINQLQKNMANQVFLKIQSMSDLHTHAESEHIFVCRNMGKIKEKPANTI